MSKHSQRKKERKRHHRQSAKRQAEEENTRSNYQHCNDQNGYLYWADQPPAFWRMVYRHHTDFAIEVMANPQNLLSAKGSVAAAAS
jgi:hypothetical protein